jgi:hypothetical protein
VTPLHGSRKHPGTHVPATQVSVPEHVLPAHGSATATHVARQVVPDAQLRATADRQGSGWQLPPRHTSPVGHELGQPVPPPPAPVLPPMELIDDPAPAVPLDWFAPAPPRPPAGWAMPPAALTPPSAKLVDATSRKLQLAAIKTKTATKAFPDHPPRYSADSVKDDGRPGVFTM